MDTQKPCEPLPVLSESHMQCYDFGAEGHTLGIPRDKVAMWVLKERRPLIFCASCCVAGWNFANGDE
jgi:hypothetical protein